MAISDKLKYTNDSKSLIKKAIQESGGSVTDSTPFRDYAKLLLSEDRWITSELFEESDDGLIYDPSDFRTLFQDRYGQTPVTAAGQPVGLILDKKHNLERGGEVLKNNDFSQGFTDWTLQSSSGEPPYGISIIGDTLVFEAHANFRNIIQYNALEANKWYEVSLTVLTRERGSLRIAVGGTNTLNMSTLGVHKFIVHVNASSFMIQDTSGENSFIGSISNLTCKQIKGNHAYQNTASRRPILRYDSECNSYYLDADGVDDALIGTYKSGANWGASAGYIIYATGAGSFLFECYNSAINNYKGSTDTQITVNAVSGSFSPPKPLIPGDRGFYNSWALGDNLPSTGMCVFARYDGSNISFNMRARLYSLITRSRVWTETEMDRLTLFNNRRLGNE